MATIQNSNCKRVLVMRLGRLGDTIMATALLDLLQKSLGNEVLIDFVASPGASTVILQLDERINEVIPVTHRKLPCAIHPAKMRLRNRSRPTHMTWLSTWSVETSVMTFTNSSMPANFWGGR